MGRKEDRIKRSLEKNAAAECNRIQQKFFPDLFDWFDQIHDPRDTRYITYSSKEMLGTIYYKVIGGVATMQEMTRRFNDERIVENIYAFLHSPQKENLPHYVTENEFLSRVDPSQIEEIRRRMIYDLIRRRSFEDARVCGKWCILVDGSELDEGMVKKNDQYLLRTYDKGKDTEFKKYHRSVLEAKIYLGKDLVASIATEPIENEPDYEALKMTDEQIKQDCEYKAFFRLADKLKRDFPRLPICIVADGLYVSERIIEICEKKGWSYIFRYKVGCAPSIAEEYELIPEKDYDGAGAEYVNDVVYHAGYINMLNYTERKTIKKQQVSTNFAWITNIRITKGNAAKLVRAGRNRWKIENQGFNRQKHWQGNIEHACSWDREAQLNHYLIEQVADLVKQLYEYFYLKKMGIKKTQKNISSDLLASFERPLTETEDTFNTQLQKAVEA